MRKPRDGSTSLMTSTISTPANGVYRHLPKAFFTPTKAFQHTMKAKKIYLMAVASLLSVLSCTSNSEESAPNGDAMTVTATLQEFKDELTGSRSQISVSNDDHISYRWAVGDVLGIFPDEGTQTEFKLSESSLSADGMSATFDGGAWGLKNGHSYYSYFPFSYDCFDKEIDKTNIPLSYLGQKQADFDDVANAGQYDFNAAGASRSSGGALSFSFKRLGAMLRIKLQLPATAAYKTLTLKTTEPVIPVKGKVNLTAATPTYISTEAASSLEVDLNNAQGEVGATKYIFVMLPPMNLNTQSQTLTATLTYGDDKSTTYSLCTAGTTTPNTPNFQPDYIYKRDAVYLSGDPVGEISGGNEEDELDANGHAYVDLGLPSGTLWATMNIGATSVTDYGGYYAWGETETKAYEKFTDKDYKFYSVSNETYSGSTKYIYITKYTHIYNGNTVAGFFKWTSNDDKTTLDVEDDVASVKWGGDWRMPTTEEFTELRTNCTFEKATVNSKTVVKVIGPNHNFIYVPLAGQMDYTNSFNQRYAGENAYLWSSTSTATLTQQAYPYNGIGAKLQIWNNQVECYTDNNQRRTGYSVRAVLKKR